MRLSRWVGLAVLAVVVAGCAAPETDDHMVKVLLPEGDTDAGRQSFVVLQCTTCHALTGSEDLPKPTTDTQAPDLTVTLKGQNRGQIATSLMNPAHTSSIKVDMWSGWSDSQRVWLGPIKPPPPEADAGEHKPMNDYRQVMTVQELCDLIAFLTANASG